MAGKIRLEPSPVRKSRPSSAMVAAASAVAAGLGAHGEHVVTVADLDPALERAFAAEGPAVVNVEIGASDFRKGALAV